MYTIIEHKKEYLELELKDLENNCFIKVIPQLGGLISELSIDGGDIFNFDRDLLSREPRNMLIGGNPPLFPIVGKLASDRYKVGAKEYSLAKHGFAHVMPWTVIEVSEEEGRISLELVYNEETLKVYPFKFRYILTYILKNGSLEIHQEYINEGDEEMPFYSGFHPFFRVGNKEHLKFGINADKYVNCADKYGDYYKSEVREYNGEIDFGRQIDFVFPLKEESLGPAEYFIEDPDSHQKIIVESSKEFKFLVMWALKGKEFICLEPWMAAPDSMNTGKNLQSVKPGESKKALITIRREAL